jgi:large subunit ribosomal protein L18
MLKKVLNRLKRKNRIRSKISWTTSIPRLSIFRSNCNIYAQIIDDTNGKTLVSSSDLKMKKEGNKTDMAKKVWLDIAKNASSKKITNVVFDRGWFVYHGRVKSLADWAREGWLQF